MSEGLKSKAMLLIAMLFLVVLIFPFNYIRGGDKLVGDRYANEHTLEAGENRTVILAEGNYQVTLVYSTNENIDLKFEIDDEVKIFSSNTINYHRVTLNQFNTSERYRSTMIVLDDEPNKCYFNKVSSTELECEIDFENPSYIQSRVITVTIGTFLLPVVILISYFTSKYIEKKD